MPTRLQPGTWFIGTELVPQEFDIIPSRNPGDGAPVVVFIAGSGGLYKNELPFFSKAPLPCWAVVLAPPGKRRVRTPSWLYSLLGQLRAITKPSKNSILLVGFSRGAAWIVDCVMNSADYVDAAIMFAPYPWTKCK